LDGLTPDRKTIHRVINNISIPAKIMIRPRHGNFIYKNDEIDMMISDIEYCKEIGVEEIVLGVLNKNSEIDIDTTSKLSELAYPMDVTFHKAVDCTPDIFVSMKHLCNLKNISSVLTSGGKNYILDSKKIIKRILKEYSSKLNIIIAGSITKENILLVHREIGAKEYHGKRIVGDLVL